jgi:septin family protein
LQIYQFPDCDSDEDEEFKQQDRELKACVPFAVVGSNTVIEVAGNKVRGRQYPWGVVEGECLSDLPLLSSHFTLYKVTVRKQHA